ncbi:MAG TPA: glycosyltransferase family 39 protein [Anaerolineae bacterium]|nr:glycosyltransferase family 39 protein [Anaerolineae bacterium]
MRRILNEWAPVIGLMLLAGALRLYMLGAWPPGLYHDEAFNGLDALRVLGGDHPLYFGANNGREPFFIYLVSLSVSLFGRSVIALRLPAALIGTLTVPATYWLAHELFNRRVGVLSAAIMAVTLWPIHLSHIGLRAVSLPLFIALFIAMGIRAYRSNRRRDWIIAGLLYGASFYTYLASRFTPAVLIVFSIVLIAVRRSRRVWPRVIFFLAAAALVIAPLAITAVNEWDVVMGRPGEISIFNPIINHGDFVGTAVSSTLKALGMFFWQGDRIPRHNVPYRPVFDPIMAIFFVVGLICLVCAVLPQRTPRAHSHSNFFLAINKLSSLFTLLWVAVMSLPTILAEDPPHFLRVVGILPLVMIIPAIGLDVVGRWIAARSKLIGIGVMSAAIIMAGVLTVRDYSQYAIDPETANAFEVAGTELARVAQADIISNQQVFIADRFIRDWTSVSFLLNGDYQTLSDGGQASIDPARSATLFVWPYEDFSKSFANLPGPLMLQVSAGPMAQGDLDPQPHVGYLRVQIDPKQSTSNITEALFDNGLRLLGHSIEVIDDGHWRLRTLWTSEQPQSNDQTFFVHLLLNNQLVVSVDGDSGDNFYPASLWRVGDVVIDQRTIELPAQADRVQLLIEMGVYSRSTGQRVKVLQSAQAVIDQAILLGGPNAVGP